jgi:hypothetical protein
MLSVRKKRRRLAAIQNRRRGSRPRCLGPVANGTPMSALPASATPGSTPVERRKIIMARRAGRIFRRRGGRPDSNRNLEDHDLGCLPLHHDHHASSLASATSAPPNAEGERRKIIMARAAGRIFRRKAGTTGLEPARARLTSECSCR